MILKGPSEQSPEGGDHLGKTEEGYSGGGFVLNVLCGFLGKEAPGLIYVFQGRLWLLQVGLSWPAALSAVGTVGLAYTQEKMDSPSGGACVMSVNYCSAGAEALNG